MLLEKVSFLVPSEVVAEKCVKRLEKLTMGLKGT